MELHENDGFPTKLPTYVSRVFPLPLRFAPTVFERWWLDRRQRSWTTLGAIARVDDGCLELEATTWSRPYPRSAVTPLREVSGRLQGRGVRPRRVSLELLPWSSTHSAIGVRYSARRVPRGRAVDRYHDLAVAVVELLRDELSAWGDSYISRVTREQRDAA